MYQDLNQYIGWLQKCIQTHESRIMYLEQTIHKMQEQLKNMNENRTIHVDKIEYKFDQLKVESLEGTLNIGLNPNDLSSIEEFDVNNHGINPTVPPKVQMLRSLAIEEAIYQYLENDLPSILIDAQTKLSIQPNPSYLTFVKQDISKQLPNRIDFYLRAREEKDQSKKEAPLTDEQIIELLKQEIENGVNIFLKNLPDHVKGMKSE